jgi:RimJ/RimL family protein N-acetyltransferase
MALRTARLILTPLSLLDEAEHAQASGNRDNALRDTRAAELQWREHGFGPWAIRDLGDKSFLGAAELRFAGDGIEGIAANEVEAGWWVRENRRNEGIATEAMSVAIGDLWSRAGTESVTAYIADGENEPSRRLATGLGFTMRSKGRGRFGEPMTVYELLRDARNRQEVENPGAESARLCQRPPCQSDVAATTSAGNAAASTTAAADLPHPQPCVARTPRRSRMTLHATKPRKTPPKIPSPRP